MSPGSELLPGPAQQQCSGDQWSEFQIRCLELQRWQVAQFSRSLGHAGQASDYNCNRSTVTRPTWLLSLGPPRSTTPWLSALSGHHDCLPGGPNCASPSPEPEGISLLQKI